MRGARLHQHGILRGVSESREYECGALRYGFARRAPPGLPTPAGRPSRFGQGMVAASAACTSSEAPAIIGVSKTPGATAQARTWSGLAFGFGFGFGLGLG